jgi:hypothetical protein
MSDTEGTVGALFGGTSMAGGLGQNRAPPPLVDANDPTFSAMLAFKEKMMQNDDASIEDGVRGINNLLNSRSPPIAQAIASGVVPVLLELASHPNEDIHYLALWSLTNIAGGKTDDVRYLIENGALEVFKRRLEDASSRVREQAVWAIGNVAGDLPEFRDMCLDTGIMPLILEICSSSQQGMSAVATWAVSNLCRGHPPPSRHDVSPVIGVMARTMMSDNITVVSDSLWSLRFLAKGSDTNQCEVASFGIIPNLIRIVTIQRWQKPVILIPAMQLIAQLAASTEEVAQELLDAGLIDALRPLFSLPKPHNGVIQESFWALSNICAGNTSQIKMASTLLPLAIGYIFSHHSDGSDRGVLNQASFCITNACSAADNDTLQELIGADIFEALLTVLEINRAYVGEFHLLVNAIEAIQFIVCKSCLIELPKVREALPSLQTTCNELLGQLGFEEHSLFAMQQILGCISASLNSDSEEVYLSS